MATFEKRERKGGAVYRAVVRIKGYPAQQRTFKRKTDAKRWAEQTEATLRRGELQKVLKPASKRTLAEGIERYSSDILPHKAKGTIRSETAHLAFWERELGRFYPAYVEADLIRKKLAELVGENIARDEEKEPPKFRSPRTIKYYRHTLGLVFKFMMKWGWATFNPVDDVEDVVKLDNQVERYLSEEERERLIKAVQESENSALYAIVMLSLSTGGRKGEVMGLTLDDVSVERKSVTFRNTKNGDHRTLPLVDGVAELIENQIKRAEALYANLPEPQRVRYLFPNRYGTKPVEINKPWYDALEAARVEAFRFHDLRHTTASYLAMMGKSHLVIAEVLGHRTLQMVKRYSHLSSEHVSGALEEMNRQHGTK